MERSNIEPFHEFVVAGKKSLNVLKVLASERPSSLLVGSCLFSKYFLYIAWYLVKNDSRFGLRQTWEPSYVFALMRVPFSDNLFQ